MTPAPCCYAHQMERYLPPAGLPLFCEALPFLQAKAARDRAYREAEKALGEWLTQVQLLDPPAENLRDWLPVAWLMEDE